MIARSSELRYIDDSRTLPCVHERGQHREVSEGTGANACVYTFSNVPAHERVIVQADEATRMPKVGIMLLDKGAHSRRARDVPEHGTPTASPAATFGDMGGYSHTVELCPLQAVDPTAQDHGECSIVRLREPAQRERADVEESGPDGATKVPTTTNS